MRIRESQRLIFGLLGLILALFGGSMYWLRATLMKEPIHEAFLQRLDYPVNAMSFSLPESPIWADMGTQAVTKEIEHYELAGTFQTYTQDLNTFSTGSSMALVDDLRSGTQLLLNEKDDLGPFVVEKIEMDRVTLSRDGQSYFLALTGNVAPTVKPESEEQPKEVVLRIEDMPALETSRFGKRVSETQWLINRQAVVDYAEEVVKNPIRIVQLYRSFSQIGTSLDDAGFQIDMKGEQEFFKSMGLGDGDVIRKANSMKMITQNRAEYLVREFMNSRMSALVLDVENDGVVRKQVFIIR
ncbi:hypothetical protein P3T73_00360 [Kiritimatiellota bacterium B12222]|nr:hypothetical protein P3T73_00360 [Kiritimatiellota bacterium B12222]